MTLPTFLKLVEIRTKLASLFPFLIGILFVIYRYDEFAPLNTAIFFSAMLLFDLTTTAINNYMDYKKALSDDYRRKSNIIGQKNIPEKVVVTSIITMLTIASLLGIWLVFRTDLFVLIIGMLCFAVGIFIHLNYIPLSRMPLGEVFSGVTMGLGITFLAIYVNAADQGIAHFGFSGYTLIFEMNVLLLLEILLVSLPCMLTIANIMLANNICDLEEDIANQRFTLPYYIGRKNALMLFHLLYLLSFAAIVSAVLLQVLPVYVLLVCLVLIPITKSIRQFRQKQSKLETFPLSLKNMMLVNGTMAITLLISVIL